jgi:hypothetical protein
MKAAERHGSSKQLISAVNSNRDAEHAERTDIIRSETKASLFGPSSGTFVS